MDRVTAGRCPVPVGSTTGQRTAKLDFKYYKSIYVNKGDTCLQSHHWRFPVEVYCWQTIRFTFSVSCPKHTDLVEGPSLNHKTCFQKQIFWIFKNVVHVGLRSFASALCWVHFIRMLLASVTWDRATVPLRVWLFSLPGHKHQLTLLLWPSLLSEEFSPPQLDQRLRQRRQSLRQLEVALVSDILQQIFWSPAGRTLPRQREQTGTEAGLCHLFTVCPNPAVVRCTANKMSSKYQRVIKCLPLFPQTDPEGRLGMRSGLLNVTDDGDTKRAKLSYNNRLYSRTAGSSVTGSTYSSAGLSRGTPS